MRVETGPMAAKLMTGVSLCPVSGLVSVIGRLVCGGRGMFAV